MLHVVKEDEDEDDDEEDAEPHRDVRTENLRSVSRPLPGTFTSKPMAIIAACKDFKHIEKVTKGRFKSCAELKAAGMCNKAAGKICEKTCQLCQPTVPAAVASAPDPNCRTGIRAGRVCCAASCGQCGGRGCHKFPGGSKNCCWGVVHRSKVSCLTTGPPCTGAKAPTALPSAAPTVTPTETPTTKPPSPSPSHTPTDSPTETPTLTPTESPTEAPTTKPPSPSPSHTPTETPSRSPSRTPTETPTAGAAPPTVDPYIQVSKMSDGKGTWCASWGQFWDRSVDWCKQECANKWGCNTVEFRISSISKGTMCKFKRCTDPGSRELACQSISCLKTTPVYGGWDIWVRKSTGGHTFAPSTPAPVSYARSPRTGTPQAVTIAPVRPKGGIVDASGTGKWEAYKYLTCTMGTSSKLASCACLLDGQRCSLGANGDKQCKANDFHSGLQKALDACEKDKADPAKNYGGCQGVSYYSTNVCYGNKCTGNSNGRTLFFLCRLRSPSTGTPFHIARGSHSKANKQYIVMAKQKPSTSKGDIGLQSVERLKCPGGKSCSSLYP